MSIPKRRRNFVITGGGIIHYFCAMGEDSSTRNVAIRKWNGVVSQRTYHFDFEDSRRSNYQCSMWTFLEKSGTSSYDETERVTQSRPHRIGLWPTLKFKCEPTHEPPASCPLCSRVFQTIFFRRLKLFTRKRDETFRSDSSGTFHTISNDLAFQAASNW